MGDFKEKNGVSRVGKFLKDVKGVFPDIGEVALKTLESGNPLSAIGHTINKLKEKGEEDEQARLLILKYDNDKREFAKELFAIEVEDRKSARKDGNQSVQKILTFIYTGAFFISMTGAIIMLYKANMQGVKFSDSSIVIITSIVTAISSKMSSIVDFHFGSSFKREKSSLNE